MCRRISLAAVIRLAAVGLLSAWPAGCANSRLARVTPTPAAVSEDLTLRVTRMDVGFVETELRPYQRLVLELEIENQGVTDSFLDTQLLSLRLSDPGDPGADLVVAPTFTRGFFESDEDDRRKRQPVLRGGQTTTVKLAFVDLADVDPFPKRITLHVALPGQPVELVLADPARNKPRWELPPLPIALFFGTTALTVGEDTLGVGLDMTAGGALGPLVLHGGVGFLMIADEGPSLIAGGGHARLVWPAAQRPWAWLPPQTFVGPHLGALAYRGQSEDVLDDGIIEPTSRSLMGAEVGVSFHYNRRRLPAAPLPLSRPPSPLGNLGVRLGYVHWGGDGLPSAGKPGFLFGAFYVP
jgi:hypothetical protein